MALASDSLAARRPSRTASTAKGPDLFGGYSHTWSGEAGLDGGHLSASFPFRGSLRIVGDLGAQYGSFAGVDLRQVTFMAGARLARNRGGRFRPFAQALAGGARTTSSVEVSGASIESHDTGWGGALGAGVDYLRWRRWALRGQGTLLLLRAGGAWDSDPQVSLGVVYRFGRS